MIIDMSYLCSIFKIPIRRAKLQTALPIGLFIHQKANAINHISTGVNSYCVYDMA